MSELPPESAVDAERRRFLQAAAGAAAVSVFGAAGGARAAAMPFPEYARHDAVGLAELVRKREVSAAEVLEAAIARAEQVNPAINAVVLKHYELAREAVRAGLPAGPLAGAPMLLKDLGVQLRGTVTSNGSAFFRDAVADYDSTLVSRYRAAGLVIFGKSASPELGQTATTESKLWGLTRNPWNREYSAGGSSGGAAAAVAAGILPAAHASDGGGSIRIPATHCGLFGLKPSRGRTPYGPKSIESWMGLSTMHAITRSVRDCAVLLDIAQGPEPGSRVVPQQPDSSYAANLHKPLKPLRIALWETNPFGRAVHKDCQAALTHAAKLCESLGHHIEPAAPDIPVMEAIGALGVMTGAGVLTAIRDREQALGRTVTEQDVERVTWRNINEAMKYDAEQLYRARAAFDRLGRIFDEFLTGYDVILSPVTAGPPPKLGELSLDQPYERFMEAAIDASPFTAPYNMSGLPAMSAPLYWNAQNLPIGSQFAGRFGDELTLLKLAAQLEAAAPWADRRPPEL